MVNSANQGGIDGFLSIISSDGGTLVKTSYFGTNGTEVLYGVQFDNLGFPYIMGTTTVRGRLSMRPSARQRANNLLPN
ncbi:MAG: hypothetical protein WDM78_10215 [Puia sp.]